MCIPSTQSKSVRERIVNRLVIQVKFLCTKNSVAPIISSNKAADGNFRQQCQVANRKIKAFYCLHGEDYTLRLKAIQTKTDKR